VKLKPLDEPRVGRLNCYELLKILHGFILELFLLPTKFNNDNSRIHLYEDRA